MIEGSDAQTVSRVHDQQRRLCDDLERLADSLAAPVSPQTLSQVARQLHSTMASATAAGQVLFQCLTRSPSLSPLDDFGPTARRLLREVEEDASYAEDLEEILMTMAGGAHPACDEALGFMARSLFLAIRRRIALESELLDLARARGLQAPAVEALKTPTS